MATKINIVDLNAFAPAPCNIILYLGLPVLFLLGFQPANGQIGYTVELNKEYKDIHLTRMRKLFNQHIENRYTNRFFGFFSQ